MRPRLAGLLLGERTSMRPRRAGLLMTAIAFARSERGQRMIRPAREKYDTAENRARARQALSGRRGAPPR